MRKFFIVPVPDGFDALPWQARVAWLSLCFFAAWDDGRTRGECWPSQGTLADVVGVSRKTVSRGVRELKKRGLVRCAATPGGNCGYVLQSQGMGLTVSGGGTHSPTKNNIKNNIKSSGAKVLTQEMFERLFEGLWEQFREFNPSGRAEARSELARLFPAGMPLNEAEKRQAELVALLCDEGLRWAANVEKGEARFNPRMGRWLKRQFGGCAR